MPLSDRFSTCSWLPLKPLLACGTLTLLLLLGGLAPLWYNSRALENDIATMRARLQAQELIEPLMKSLTEYLEESRVLLDAPAPLPAPDNLTQVLESLQKLADQAQIRNASFVPEAETVLATGNRIRLTGTLTGTPEHFRRLALLIEAQPWLSGPYHLEIEAKEFSDFTLSLWAVFRPQ